MKNPAFEQKHKRSAGGQFVPMPLSGQPPAAAAHDVDLVVVPRQDSPPLGGMAWADTQIDGIVAEAVSAGYDPELAREGVVEAVEQAAKVHQAAIEDPVLKGRLLGIAESEIEKVLEDHYYDPGSSGNGAGRGDEVLDAVGEKWGDAMAAYCGENGCELDELVVLSGPVTEYSEERKDGVEFWVRSEVEKACQTSTPLQKSESSGLGQARVQAKNDATGDMMDVVVRDSPGGMEVSASFGAFWEMDEVGLIGDGHYDLAFRNQESNFRSAASS